MKHPFSDPCTILVVDDDAELLATLGDLLAAQKYRVRMASSGPEALALLRQPKTEGAICLALVDLVMPVLDGLTLLKEIQSLSEIIPVMMMTGYGTVETAVQAMKQGAEDFLIKPFDKEAVLKKVARLLDLHRLRLQVAELQVFSFGRFGTGSPFGGIIACSPQMQSLLERAEAAARSDLPVLLLGETGTGKELLARAIHHSSGRSTGPFIPVNCGALPRDLIESELFGHQRGAFTGALTEQEGLFRAANGGTILLDEIGELSKEAQVKLLRILHEGELRPIGSAHAVKVNVRTISASNRPLASMRQEFLREDLYYRISTITIELPPLRERREDLPLLTEHYLRTFSEKYGRSASLDRRALDMLLSYPFPGNVRELVNILESAVATLPPDQETLGERDLRPLLRPVGERVGAGKGLPSPEEKREAMLGSDAALLSMESLEKFAVQQALHLSGQNKSRAAEILGISRDSLYRKLRQFGLDPEKDKK
jgi:DNA-binding NtrC family response regulator